MRYQPDVLKSCALFLILSMAVLPHLASGQNFNLAFETRANGTITGLEVLNTPDGDLIVATSRRHIYWFDLGRSLGSVQVRFYC